MYVNELKMLRNKAFSNHPWKLSNVHNSVARIRREFGVETWELVTKTLEKARATKDEALWYSVIDSLILRVNQPNRPVVLKDGVTCWKCAKLFSVSTLPTGALTLWCTSCRTK
jgi:hypothetical protein